MKEIAFYIETQSIQNVDCRNIHLGNPGMGGTEYLFIALASELSLKRDLVNITLLTTSQMLLPEHLKYDIVNHLDGAVSYCNNHKIDYLVVRYLSHSSAYNITQLSYKPKFIIWAHNFLSRKNLSFYHSLDFVSRIICVGREQLDLYRDHRAFEKSEYIYNFLPMDIYNNDMPRWEDRANNVVYLGSIVPAKGFHILAKAWKKVLNEVPDAELWIIGNGTVYGSAALGEYGIAESNYESSFISYLTDRHGCILPSVKFFGKMGGGKILNVLKECKVGVPNPSGETETFCLSAVEMEMCGCRIVTKNYVGFLDTVPPCAGTLFGEEEDLAECIIDELLRGAYNPCETFKYCRSRFSVDIAVSRWLKMFSDIACKKPAHHEPFLVNKSYRLKYLRDFNRKIKHILPFGYYIIPTVMRVEELLKRVSRFLRKK